MGESGRDPRTRRSPSGKPKQVYTASRRSYPERLEDPSYGPDEQVRRVRSSGEIKWRGAMRFISEALIGEAVGIREREDGHWLVRFADVPLFLIDRRPEKSPVLVRGRRSGPKRSSRTQPGDCQGCIWTKMSAMYRVARPRQRGDRLAGEQRAASLASLTATPFGSGTEPGPAVLRALRWESASDRSIYRLARRRQRRRRVPCCAWACAAALP
jgi:hypothetical protein